MRTFMAGASSTGQVTAVYRVDRKSSATPPANLPRMSAVAGATSSRSPQRARSMCSTPVWPGSCSAPTETGRPDKVCRVNGVRKRVAAVVITTDTSISWLFRSRVMSAAL